MKPAVAFCLLTASAALAQQDAPGQPVPVSQPKQQQDEHHGAIDKPLEGRSGWSASIEPAAWYVAAGGNVTMPRQSGGTNNSTHLSVLNMDSPDLAATGEINLRNGDWRVTLRGFSFSTTNNTTLANGGQIGDINFGSNTPFESSLDFAAFELEGAYNLYHRDLRALPKGHAMHVDWDVVAGVRLYDVEWQISRTDIAGPGVTTESANEFFYEPEVGGKLSMEFYDRFTVDAQVSVGALPFGDRSTFSVDVIAGFTYRPIENVGVQIGYRQLAFELADGDGAEEFRYRGALAGLYFGAVIKF